MEKKLIHITSTQVFTEHVKNSECPVVIDLHAKWCGPCKKISPLYESFVKKYPQVQFCKMDIDDPNVKDLVAIFEITSVPTFLFFKDGNIHDKVEGSDMKKVMGLIETL